MNATSPRNRRLLLLATLLALVAGTAGALMFSCQGDMDDVPPLEGVALTAGVEQLVATEAPSSPAVLADREAPEVQDPDASIGLAWAFDPPILQVYRSTAVHFRLDTAPDGHPTASCSWNFGDGSPAEKGCNASHTFHGGQADQVVTLILDDGDWTWRSTRTVPLERLEVVDGLLDDLAAGGVDGLPARPEPSPTSFRFAVLADTAASGGVPSDVKAGVGALQKHLIPDLVVHAGGVVVDGGGDAGWDLAKDAILGPLSDLDAGVAWAMSPTDLDEGAQVKQAPLQMIDARFYPERYTFTQKGAFFLVLSASERDGVSEETIHWIRDELSKARVYEARYVVSYLPLHKFTDEHLGTLDKKFRLYELFLRARVTTLFSAGYRVYFKGRYGALPVVSVGALAGAGGQLAGSDFAQPSSLVVVDQIDGVPERVFAVEGPTFDRALDETLLPDTVEVYTR